MKFIWDPAKAADNIAKHDGVSFDQAVETSYDELAIEEYDADHSTADEKRFKRIGLSTRRLLVVVLIDLTFDEEGEEVYRIISARKAERQERRIYEKFNQEASEEP